jgi:iron complex transport system permease protein
MRTVWLAVALCALLLALAVAELLAGPGHVGLADLLRGPDATQATILWELRLPRICVAVLAGASLAVSGALMQTFFRNPLAEPYVTGVSAGAALGAVLAGTFSGGVASLTGLPVEVQTALGALLGGAAITAALYAFALRHRTGSSSLILLGIALGTFCGSLVHLVLLREGSNAMGSAIAWLLGHVSAVGYTAVWSLLAAALAGGALAWRYVPELDALLLGEEKAASLGVNLLAARRGILGAATLLATVCVAFCGVIAFVGLMVPHILRSAVGPLHARLLPLAALGGAVLTLGVDLVARTVDPPREIPLTIITSVLGAPFFIAVLLRSREVRL